MKPTDILGNIKLYNADCMEVMKTFKDKQFSLAIVDPPYGIDVANMNMGAGKGKRCSNIQNRNWKPKDWDKETPTEEYWEQLFRVSKNQIVWGGNYMTDKLYPSPCWLIWDKMQEFSGAVFEMAWTSFKSPAKAFRMSRVEAYANQNKIHPTQKPVALYKWLLQNYAKEGDTILDTHFGSLSIGIACHDMKFDLTAIELDKDYYEQAKQRLINHQRQLTLF